MTLLSVEVTLLVIWTTEFSTFLKICVSVESVVMVSEPSEPDGPGGPGGPGGPCGHGGP